MIFVRYRKEIKNLIQIIKQEKEQINTDLEKLSNELNKYKISNKKLVSQKKIFLNEVNKLILFCY